MVHNSGIIEEKAITNIEALNIQAAHSLDNEVIALSLIDIERFILTAEGILLYLIKR